MAEERGELGEKAQRGEGVIGVLEYPQWPNQENGSVMMTNAQTTLRPSMSPKKAGRLGREIYKRDILPKVKDDHFGEYVAIDVLTGEWEMSDDEMDAVDSLRERCPDAVDVFCKRVGYRALVSFGGSVLEESE